MVLQDVSNVSGSKMEEEATTVDQTESTSTLKRPPQSDITRNDDKNDNKEEMNATDWKTLYWKLQRERTTVAEKNLVAFTAANKKRDQAKGKYIERLERDLAAALSRIERYKSEAAKVVPLQQEKEENERTMGCLKRRIGEISNDLEKSKRHCQSQSVKLEFYETLSGIHVRKMEGNKYLCSMVNQETQASIKFTISELSTSSSSPSPGVFRFDPVENFEILPSFLQSAIEFEKSQCPPLLENVLRAVFPEE